MKAKAPTAYEGLIDATQFRTVTYYLKSPRSPILFLLHVNERAQLSALAAQLEPALDSPSRTREILDPQLQEGTLRISSRMPLPESFPGTHVDPSTIQPNADCEVLWMEPFYLVHTPGLFEGQLQIAPGTIEDHAQSQPCSESSMEPHDQSNEHGMSH